MSVIAISDKENARVVQFGNMYIFQTKDVLGYLWKDIKKTEEEWLASKWILDYKLTVSTNYPTIAEIRNRQSEEHAK